MTHNIIIAADEELACPKCGHHYPLDQGITRQTIERYEADFEAVLKVRVSPGLRTHKYVGNFEDRAEHEADLAVVDCEKSVLVTLK